MYYSSTLHIVYVHLLFERMWWSMYGLKVFDYCLLIMVSVIAVCFLRKSLKKGANKQLNVGLFMLFLTIVARYLYENSAVSLTINGANCNIVFEVLFWLSFTISILLLIIGKAKQIKRHKENKSQNEHE